MDQIITPKNRGFKLSTKIIKIFKCVFPKRSKFGKWSKSNRNYFRVGHDPGFKTEPDHVPKGCLAVYVGERENETMQVIVPVLFLNHPLFGKLLKDAEDVYGFNHPGRIRIPCKLSEFMLVERKIAAGEKEKRRLRCLR